MIRRFNFSVFLAILFLFAWLAFPSSTYAGSSRIPKPADSAYALIDAVNALRVSNGRTPYNINPILMYTAQTQADYMAATGTVTHYGPGGIDVTDRLLFAGYPLAGDLSLGGFRSENIISGTEDMPAENAVEQWTGDAPHLDTMLSPNLTEIGAGVAVANGRVYYVIDAAHPTTGGSVPVETQVVVAGSAVPEAEAPAAVVLVSTPNADGEVVHEVIFGQSLWQIAISYDVRIDDIKRLNNLFDDNIYPGEKLLIKMETPVGDEVPTASSTVTVSPPPVTASVTAMPVATLAAPTLVPPAVARTDQSANGSIMAWAIGIIALALLAGGFFTWLGASRKLSS